MSMKTKPEEDYITSMLNEQKENKEEFRNSLLKEKNENDFSKNIHNAIDKKKSSQNSDYKNNTEPEPTPQQKDEKVGSVFFMFFGIVILFVSLIIAFEYDPLWGAVCAAASIPFFALHRIVNLLIDIYNKMK